MSDTLPNGFHFVPTDQEMIGFLLQKSKGLPLPPSSVEQLLEKELYGENADPWQVFSDVSDSLWYTTVADQDKKKTKNVESVIHVFTKLSKVAAGKSRVARRAGCGQWGGRTSAREIKSGDGTLIGARKMFSFLDEKKGDHDDIHWIMHEYSLAGESLTGSDHEFTEKDLVICRIKKVYTEEKQALVQVQHPHPVFYQFPI